MKPSALTVAALLEPLREPLGLQGALPRAAATARAASVGFFNPAHPSAIQVVGDAAVAYLARLTDPERAALPAQLARRGLALSIATEGADPAPWGAFTSDRPAHEVVYALRCALAAAQSRVLTVHGVLVDVHGIGALITGAAGAGKGSLALELVARGHALVADDAVELERPAAGILFGHAAGVLRGYLEVRGLGVLDVQKMHGRRAVKPECRVELVIELTKGRAGRLTDVQRLAGRRGRRRLLGVALPVISLPARSRHNLAPLVEAACLDQRLRINGVDPVEALVRRQARAIEKSK